MLVVISCYHLYFTIPLVIHDYNDYPSYLVQYFYRYYPIRSLTLDLHRTVPFTPTQRPFRDPVVCYLHLRRALPGKWLYRREIPNKNQLKKETQKVSRAN